jgi:hypothetical protein
MNKLVVIQTVITIKLFLWYVVYCQDHTTITTGLGNITGIHRSVLGSKVYEFRKIPFAKPPVGNLRFEKPEKFGPWKDTLDATRFGPSCIQVLSFQSIVPNTTISEDCYISKSCGNCCVVLTIDYIPQKELYGDNRLYDD